MRVIPPIIITDAMFTSSTVVETAPAAYAGGTTYAINNTASVAGAAGLLTVYKSLQNGNIGHAPASSPTWWQSLGETYQLYSGAATYALADRVIDAAKHLVYESRVAGNIGNPLTDTTKWLEVQATNKWALFDNTRNTQTTVPLTFIMVFAPGVRCNSLSLSGLVANSFSLTVTSAAYGGTIYSASGSLNTRETLGWYDYFFGPFSTKKSRVFFDIPPYTDAIFTLTLSVTSGNASCGACIVGSHIYLGDIQWDAVSDTLNFSTITRDAFAKATLVPRRNVPKTKQVLDVAKARVNQIRAVRDLLNATPAYWSGLDNDADGYFEAVEIVGVYKQFTIDLKNAVNAKIVLELEEI